MPGEPMQGPGNSGFRITSDLAKQIVHRQEKDRLWILLTFFIVPLCCIIAKAISNLGNSDRSSSTSRGT